MAEIIGIWHEAQLLDDGTVIIETDDLERINRVILSQGTWCKIFYQDGDDTDKLCGTEINEMYLDISGDGTVVEVLKGGDTDED